MKPLVGPKSGTGGREHPEMVRARLRRWAGVLAVMAGVFSAGAAVAAMSAQDWLDTISVPLRSDSAPSAPSSTGACPGVGAIAFEPGTADLSSDGAHTLDALASAMASSELENSAFQILWLASAGETGRPADERLGRIEALLRAHPALPAERLMIIHGAASKLVDCLRSAAPNTLLLQVRIAGRWWGGQ